MLDRELIESFRHTLFAGKYNLLLGSGISLESHDRNGVFLRGTEKLRQDICELTGARAGTSLSRAYGLLTEQQRRTELIHRYSNCQPGEELHPIRKCLWKRIFTFNIDDVVENLYRDADDPAQELTTINFDSPFEPDTDVSELQCIHLHGFARQPEKGLVFSHNEYARILQGNNPWMMLLSEILPCESFVIAGASLNEVDLEYYLARRTSSSPRRGRGPSLLVEPNPDAATQADCERYQLTLVEADFGDFLAWIERALPDRPTAQGLIVPPVEDMFRSTITPAALLRFFSDFELVSHGPTTNVVTPSAYMYGAEPTWSDIAEHLDVERKTNQVVMDRVVKWLDGTPTEGCVLMISEGPATGKSTLLKRVGHDLASVGRIVFHVRTLSRVDIKTAAYCLSQRTSPSVILVDNFADYAEQIRGLLNEVGDSARVAVLGVERGYRKEHIDVVLSGTSFVDLGLDDPTASELDQLLEKYQQSGLVADRYLAGNRRQAVQALRGDPIAVSVCRILKDFRPLDRIIESVWEAASEKEREIYMRAR